jgi:deoxyribodipyrimidine photo-lyase
LKSLDKFDEYNTNRDLLTYNTLRISAHLNFGVISEREFYTEVVKHLGNKSLLINQVIWRDYFLCMLRYLKGANSYEDHMDDRYNKLKWLDYYSKPFKNNTHKRSYEEWKIMMESKTGFLLVDACLNEIKTTGYMHNRGRLIVGYFSTKYLLINPLAPYVGLQSWFSRHLVDCLTSQNKLNCQFLTELDFSGKKFSKKVIDGRPMNISNLMIKKYDPSCEYIKKWLPHLKDVDNKILYKWDVDYDDKLHPGPMFDAKSRYQEWIKLCT